MIKLILFFTLATQVAFSPQLGSAQYGSVATQTLFEIFQGRTTQGNIAVGLNAFLEDILGLRTTSVDSANPSSNSYDFVWDINSVSQLLSGKPWHVYWAPQVTLETFSNPKECTTQGQIPKVTRIGVFGQFNRGKTVILNAIAGLNLPTGEIQHTPGISVKRYGCDIALLDSAGSSVPVDHTPEMLRDRQATDAFLQEILYTNSDIAIVVVNTLTLEDQKFLDSVYNRMTKKQGKFAKIFVVHNFKDIEISEHVEIAIQNDIVFILKAKRSAATKNAVVYESENFYHFIFARAGTEAGKFYNANTAQAIKDIALGLKLFSHELPKFWDTLIESASLRYLQFIEPVEKEEVEQTVCDMDVDGTTQCEQQQQQQQAIVNKVYKVEIDVLTGFVKNIPKDPEKLKLTYTYPSTSIKLEELNAKVKWTIGEIIATTDGKTPLVPGDFILRSNLRFGCGQLRWTFEDTFVPKHTVYLKKDQQEAVIVIDVGLTEETPWYGILGDQSSLIGAHLAYELPDEAKSRFDKTYSDITSGTFESEFKVPFFIDREKSAIKHDAEKGLVIMELYAQKQTFVTGEKLSKK